MAFIYRDGIKYTAVIDEDALPVSGINKHAIYRLSDSDGTNHLYVRNQDDDGWFEIQEAEPFEYSTESDPGESGIVPQPEAGSGTRVLDSNKGWTDLKEDTDFVFNGAGRNTDGKQGIVPKPLVANHDDVLTGDGKWRTAFIGDLLDTNQHYDLDASPYLAEYVRKAYLKKDYKSGVVSEKVLFPAKVKIPPSTSYSYGSCELTISTNEDGERTTLVLHERFTLAENSAYAVVKDPIIYERFGTHGRPSYFAADITNPAEYTWTDWTAGFIYATETTDGNYGHVPKPNAGSKTRVLDSNKGWTDLQTDTDFVFTKPTELASGKGGTVPAAKANELEYIVTSDSKWVPPFIGCNGEHYMWNKSNTPYERYILPLTKGVDAGDGKDYQTKIYAYSTYVDIPGYSTSSMYGVCKMEVHLNVNRHEVFVVQRFTQMNRDTSTRPVSPFISFMRTGFLANWTVASSGLYDSYEWSDWEQCDYDFTPATTEKDGMRGYVPAPEAGSETRVLDANKGWTDIKEDEDFVFDGATWEEDGKAGVVPQPPIEGQDKVLTGGGEWRDPFIGATTADCYSLDNTVSLSSFEFRDWINRWIVPSIKSIEASPDSMPYAKRSEVISIPSQIYATKSDGMETNLYGTGTMEIAYDKNGKCISMHIRFVDNDYSMIEEQYQYECEGYIEDWGTDGGNALVYDNWHFTPWREIRPLSVFEGATIEDDGKAGIVPAPTAEEFNDVLCADGKWDYPHIGSKSSAYISLEDDGAYYQYVGPVVDEIKDDDDIKYLTKVVSFPSHMIYYSNKFGQCVMEIILNKDRKSIVLKETFTINHSSDNGEVYCRVETLDDWDNNNYKKSNSYTKRTWIKLYSDFDGATSENEGTTGLVPKPVAGDENKFLKGDGTWADVSLDELPRGTRTGNRIYDPYYMTYPLSVAAEIKRYLKVGESFDFKMPINGSSSEFPGYTWSTGYLYVMVLRFSTTTLYVYENYTDIMETKLIHTRYCNVPTTADEDLDLNEYKSVDCDWKAWNKLYPEDYIKSTSSKNGSKGLVPEPAAGTSTRVLSANNGWTDIKTNADFLFGGATDSTNGSAGLVPAPGANKQNTFLKGDGTWASTPYPSVMTGASSSAGGSSGLVPTPTSGKQSSFLRGDATWATPPYPSVMTGATADNPGASGLVPTPGKGSQNYFLKGNGVWSSLPALSTSQAGVVSTAPNSTTKFLRGDATWSTLPSLSTSQSGIVSTAPGDVTKCLRGDATWNVPEIAKMQKTDTTQLSSTAFYTLDYIKETTSQTRPSAYFPIKETASVTTTMEYTVPALTNAIPTYSSSTTPTYTTMYGMATIRIYRDRSSSTTKNAIIDVTFRRSQVSAHTPELEWRRTGFMNGKDKAVEDTDVEWSAWQQTYSASNKFLAKFTCNSTYFTSAAVQEAVKIAPNTYIVHVTCTTNAALTAQKEYQIALANGLQIEGKNAAIATTSGIYGTSGNVHGVCCFGNNGAIYGRFDTAVASGTGIRIISTVVMPTT